MSFIGIFTGQYIDYLNVIPEQINTEDIAVSLSNICLFAGHLPESYSVAQHSALCRMIVSAEMSAPVKYVDLIMRITGRSNLEIDDGSIWPILDGVLSSGEIIINPLKSGLFYGLFLNRFHPLVENI